MACINAKLLWIYCPGYAGMKGKDEADKRVGNATNTSGLRLRRSEVLRSLRHHLRAQSHHANDHLEEGGVERGTAYQSSLNGQKKGLSNHP